MARSSPHEKVSVGVAKVSARPGVAQARHHKPRPRTDLSWQELANCKDADPRAFFDSTRYAEAQLVCIGCPVKIPCRQYGRKQPGVWGGVVNEEKKK